MYTHVLGQVRRTQEHTNTRAAVTSDGPQGERVGKGTHGPPLKCMHMLLCPEMLQSHMWRDAGSVGTLLHTQAHKQTPIRPRAHSATSTRARAHIHAAMLGMPCTDPAHACVYTSPRTPGSSHRQTALTAGVGARQPRAAVARDMDVGPPRLPGLPRQLKKVSNHSRVFKMLRIRW